MSHEDPEFEPGEAAIMKELFTEMERESGDGEATREDFLVALDFTARYRRALESQEFWEMVEKGEFSVTDRWKTDAHGQKTLAYIEIRDKGGAILLQENIEALEKIAEQNRALADGGKK